MHPAAVAWGDDEGRQRLSIETPAGSFAHPLALQTGPASIGAPLNRTLLQGQMHLSRGRQPEAGGGVQQLPRARRPVCLALSGRESHALAEAPGHCGPDRSGWGAHGWGTVVLMIVCDRRRYCSYS